MMKCARCDSDTDQRCGRCGTPVCPSHRWGTGSLSDGYFCLVICGSASGAGRRARRGLREGISPLHYLIVAAAVAFFVSYLLVAACSTR